MRFSLIYTKGMRRYANKKYRMEVSAMAAQMKKIECPSPCNFSVKSHDEKELVEIAMQHAKKSHNMSITEQDVKKMIKPA
jgi:predicted small metal-binding protein